MIPITILVFLVFNFMLPVLIPSFIAIFYLLLTVTCGSGIFCSLWIMQECVNFLKQTGRDFGKIKFMATILEHITVPTFDTKFEDFGQQAIRDNPSQVHAFAWMAFIVAVICFLIFVIGICLYGRVKLAGEIVKEASRALKRVYSVVLFNLFGLILYAAIFLFGFTSILWIRNASPQAVKDYPWLQNTSTLVAVLVLTIWLLRFCYYWGYFVISGALADFYFSNTHKFGSGFGGQGQLDAWPVFRSMGRSFLHFGTIAIVSFMMTVLDTFQLVSFLKWIRNNGTNWLPQCLLNGLSWIVDKVNKNTLIYCALYGTDYGRSTVKSSALAISNVLRLSALKSVAWIATWFGSFFCASVSTIIGYLWFKMDGKAITTEYVWLPFICCFVLAFIVTRYCMLCLLCALDTTFLCFLVDEQCNRGDMFASMSLKHCIGESCEYFDTDAKHKRSSNLEMSANSRPPV